MVGHVPCRAFNPGPSRAYIVFLPTRILSSILILLSLFLIRPRCFCADDIAILACSKHEAQALLEIALILTDKDLVRINPTKTDLVSLTRKATNFELNMGANSIEQTNETKHLGLIIL
jgi:hypothetical protein